MPSANLELVRSISAAWERGDYGSTKWAHSDIEFASVGGPSAVSRIGPAGMAERWREFLSAWEYYRPEVSEYREIDDARVLVLVQLRARGKTSGVDVRTKGAHLFHVRSGKITTIVFYWDRERAFADLGLSPEGDAGDAGTEG